MTMSPWTILDVKRIHLTSVGEMDHSSRFLLLCVMDFFLGNKSLERGTSNLFEKTYCFFKIYFQINT